MMKGKKDPFLKQVAGVMKTLNQGGVTIHIIAVMLPQLKGGGAGLVSYCASIAPQGRR